MDYRVWAGILSGLVFLVFFFGWQERKKQRKKCLLRLKTEYGKPLEAKPELSRQESISSYHKHHLPRERIDDITWNDLGMDQIFSMLNYTYSASGEEYLYHTLRTPVFGEEELMVREQEIVYFMEHEEQRQTLQMIFWRIGKKDRCSLYDHLDFLKESYGRKKPGAAAWLPMCLVLLAVALLLVRTGAGLVMLLVVISFNIFHYFNQKGKLRPYLNGLRYLVRLFSAGREIGRIEMESCREQIQDIREISKEFQPLLKKAKFVFASDTGTGNPLEILRDYINMIFHFDLIRLNSMLSIIESKEADIDRLNTAIGYLETMIAVGSFRSCLARKEGYCLPEFGADGGPVQEAGEIYHLMLEHPVKNSYCIGGPILITGSNASGKSTFLKTMAINQIFAQTIHTVCAERFRTRFYRVYSSMALKDDLKRGDSYFTAEIKAMKRIVERGGTEGAPVLCFVDEVLRGTNTVERIAASTQILRSLARQGVICAAATHDIELTILLEEDYENYHFTELVEENDIAFNYKLLNGRADSRNAIRLLQLMGYDARLVDQAEEMAQRFIRTNQWS